MKRFLLIAALLLAFVPVASAQESEFSGGGGGTAGAITAGVGSGNAGRVPQFASATSVVDSKMLTSGTNSGTWTLYDSTGGSGLTKLILRDGAGNSSAQAVLEPYADGTEFIGSTTKRFNVIAYSFGTVSGGPPGGMLLGSGTAAFRYYGGSVSIGSTATFDFSTGDPAAVGNDLGFTRSAPGILKVTDGSTGSGGIGISDAATNTVTDALILRHATTDGSFGQDGFGTGLLFQAENDVGTMHDAASIDAVFTDSGDGSEDSEVRFSTYAGGAEVANVLTIGNASSITTVAAPVNLRVQSNTSGYLELITPGTGPVFLGTQGAGRWQIEADGDFVALGDNVLDVGSSANKVKDAYLGTSIQGTRTQAITDAAAAATFVTVAAASSNTTVGGRIFYTITAIDAGTAIQTKTGTYSFGINNIAGTVTGAGTDVLEHSQLSTGTLAPTFSVNISGTNAQFQLVLDTSLDAGAEILKIEYRVQIDSGTATVTPAT